MYKENEILCGDLDGMFVAVATNIEERLANRELANLIIRAREAALIKVRIEKRNVVRRLLRGLVENSQPSFKFSTEDLADALVIRRKIKKEFVECY